MGLDQWAYKILDEEAGDQPDESLLRIEIAYWRKHANLQGWMENLWLAKLKKAKLEKASVDTSDSTHELTLMSGDYNGLDAVDEFSEEEVSFNCQPLRLTIEDIQRLRNDITNASLPTTTGFFFGSGSDDVYYSQDLAFCDEAEEVLKSGGKIEYDSWW